VTLAFFFFATSFVHSERNSNGVRVGRGKDQTRTPIRTTKESRCVNSMIRGQVQRYHDEARGRTNLVKTKSSFLSPDFRSTKTGQHPIYSKKTNLKKKKKSQTPRSPGFGVSACAGPKHHIMAALTASSSPTPCPSRLRTHRLASAMVSCRPAQQFQFKYHCALCDLDRLACRLGRGVLFPSRPAPARTASV